MRNLLAASNRSTPNVTAPSFCDDTIKGLSCWDALYTTMRPRRSLQNKENHYHWLKSGEGYTGLVLLW